MPEFVGKVALAADVEKVFAFLTDPHNLSELAPEDTELRILAAPGQLELGSVIEFQVDHFGIPQRLAHQLTEWSPPQRFVEEQTRGPLKKYVHEHIFEVLPDGGVQVIDRIEFEPPGGLLGRIVTADFLRRQLEEGFAYRYEQLTQRFGSTAPQ